MEPAATAEREGVSFSLHSDANVTPLGQLHTMWCAVNRVTPSGRVLGEHERISPHSALRSVTLGSAHQLHLDHEFGTLECGKAADFTVLEDDPLTVDPMAIRDIGVWGTVVGGVPFEAAAAGALDPTTRPPLTPPHPPRLLTNPGRPASSPSSLHVCVAFARLCNARIATQTWISFS